MNNQNDQINIISDSYVLDLINGKLTLIELTQFTKLLEPIFIKNGNLNEAKIIRFKKMLIKNYLKEKEITNSYENKNSIIYNNFYYNLSRYLDKHVIKDSSINCYQYTKSLGINNSISALFFNLDCSLNENIKGTSLIDNKIVKEIKSRNTMFLLDKIFNIYYNKKPLLVKNKIFDYDNILDFKAFIKELVILTENTELLKYNLKNYKYLNKKYPEVKKEVKKSTPIKVKTIFNEVDPEELPF